MITKEILDRVLTLENTINDFYNSIDNNVNKRLKDQNSIIELVKKQVTELEQQISALKTSETERFNQIQINNEETRTQISREVSDIKRTLQGINNRISEITEKQQGRNDEVATLEMSISRFQTSLMDYDRRLQRVEQTISKRSAIQNGNDSSLVGKHSGKDILSYCALAFTVLLCVGLVISVIFFRNRLVETQARMDDMSADIEKLSTTAVPTPIPTPIQTPVPTPEPTQEPTESPVIVALQDVMPGILEWEEVSEPLSGLGEEVLCQFEKNGIYAIILANETRQSAFESGLFEAFDLEKLIYVDKPGFDELTAQYESTSNLETAEPNAMSPEPSTDDTYDETEKYVHESDVSTEQSTESKNVILKTVWIGDQYLCVFFVKQTKAEDVDYRQVLSVLQSLCDEETTVHMSDCITVWEDNRYYPYIKQAWDKEAGYPISDSFVPDELLNTIPEDVQDVVWLYRFSRRDFVLVYMPDLETDVVSYQTLIESSVKNLGDEYVTRVVVTDNAVLVFFCESEESLSENEELAWYVLENDSEIQN